MRKYCSALLAVAVMLCMLSGCRGNVSDRTDGKITEPTGTVATMPSTDTAPIATAPSAVTEGTNPGSMTDSTAQTETGTTGDTSPADPSTPEGRARHAHPRDPMQRN